MHWKLFSPIQVGTMELKNRLVVGPVVLALGSVPYDPLSEKLKEKIKKAVTIGDAALVSQGIEAIEAGFMVGYDI